MQLNIINDIDEDTFACQPYKIRLQSREQCFMGNIIAKYCILVFFLITSLANIYALPVFSEPVFSDQDQPESEKKFTEIFIFGDSLSDNGNLNKRTFELALDYPFGPISPISTLYYDGRFTNGKVWVEKLYEKLNIPEDLVFNYAYGGAGVIKDFYPVADLTKQIDTFLSWNISTYHNALYIIWLGTNDFMRNLYSQDEQLIKKMTETIAYNIKRLVAKGAYYILVPALIDISSNPLSAKIDKINGNNNYSSKMRAIFLEYNNKLIELLDKMQIEFPDVQFITYDFAEMTLENKENKENLEKYGFKNINQACNLNDYVHDDLEICSNPDEYLFWDYIHPTKKAHAMLADIIYNKLKKILAQS